MASPVIPTAVTADDFIATQYDYLIVGAGPAGLTLAARLSEDPDIVVGVIEAGDHLSGLAEIDIPGMAVSALELPRINWSFLSKPQSGANGRRIFYPSGKAVGGSTVLNLMSMGRASAKEYDAFESLGNAGWNWAGLLPYFKKACRTAASTIPRDLTATPIEVANAYHVVHKDEFHGSNGPIQKSFPRWLNDLHLPFLQACDNLGLPFNEDPESGKNLGAHTETFAIDPTRATRVTASTAYYRPRKNLVILSGANATRIVLGKDADNGVVASGVVFVKGEGTFTASAKREVILSAGAFKSPQLLELSGIGKQSVLEKHGIQQVIDLPVGDNLLEIHSRVQWLLRAHEEEHPWVPFTFEVTDQFETYDGLRDPIALAEQINLYTQKRLGMMSSVASAVSFVSHKVALTEEEHAAFQSSVDSLGAHVKHRSLLREWSEDPEQAAFELLQVPGFVTLGEHEPVEGARYHTLMTGLLHPLSRGSVHIASSDPLASPDIDLGILAEPADLDVLVSALRFCRKLAGTEPYKVAFKGDFEPPADVQSDEALRAWAQDRVEPFFHTVGTAPMLPLESGGVVDPNLKVYGTRNIRVVDASIIPIQLSCPPMATVYAIAEKACRAADLIKST
ncbi:alcohol oxidase [Artomyces pyxidatus]|uniref:Alcohol oxidase n=1 Tax=Artomyces pyxidatus TaxID=48021 RepID=A0ACB8SGP2_9AGAM|nr:alcohol oxidase [Artomyces pyxidatus]